MVSWRSTGYWFHRNSFGNIGIAANVIRKCCFRVINLTPDYDIGDWLWYFEVLHISLESTTHGINGFCPLFGSALSRLILASAWHISLLYYEGFGSPCNEPRYYQQRHGCGCDFFAVKITDCERARVPSNTILDCQIGVTCQINLT